MQASILVVDNDPMILNAFEKILRNENFIISTSSHSDETLKIISEKKPHLVILDIKMPGDAELDLLRQIKKKYQTLPVIIMTAYTNIFTEKDAYKLGADDYLKKPFEINTMLLKLRTLIHI